MLLHDFVHVALPLEEVRRRLTGEAGVWLTPLAVDASGEEEDLRVRVGPLGDAPVLSRTVLVSAGEPIDRGDGVILPITWHAERMASAFPVLQADLEAASLGPDHTQVTLMGRYDPPLGGLGRQLDRLLLHRVAQASVRSFLVRVRDVLEAECSRAMPRAAGGGGGPTSHGGRMADASLAG